jgi:hypothetical protein
MLQDNLPTHTDNHSGKQTCSAQTMVTEMAAMIMFCTDTGNGSDGKVCFAQTLENATAARHMFCTHTVTSVTFNNFGQIFGTQTKISST